MGFDGISLFDCWVGATWVSAVEMKWALKKNLVTKIYKEFFTSQLLHMLWKRLSRDCRFWLSNVCSVVGLPLCFGFYFLRKREGKLQFECSLVGWGKYLLLAEFLQPRNCDVWAFIINDGC